MKNEISVEGMRLDSHKLIYHPKEVGEWKEGKQIVPLNLEIGISGGCNHRCLFCVFEYMNYKPDFIDTDTLLENIEWLSKNGLKSILIAGTGEPLLHKDVVYIIEKITSYGIDVALSTNGALFTENIARQLLPLLSWIRFSVAAPTEATYTKIHRCPEGDFCKVMSNIENAVRLKKELNAKITLGVQMLLIPENRKEIILMAEKMQKLDVDYLSLKPYGQNPILTEREKMDYTEVDGMYGQLKRLETERFKVQVRKNLIEQLEVKKPAFHECHMLDFSAVIDAKGNVVPCTALNDYEECFYGNLYQESFQKIWNSERRNCIKKRIATKLFEKICCSDICKFKVHNNYLNELLNPHPHVNFI